MMFSKALIKKSTDLLALCKKKKLMLVTAESCTGGLLAALLTDVPGASHVFAHGFVTYSNKAKHELIGVSDYLLKKYGAVSKEVASAMALGAVHETPAWLSMAITGIAGPGGGTKKKPVGLVHFATALGEEVEHQKRLFRGSRTQIRLAAVEHALDMLLDRVKLV